VTLLLHCVAHAVPLDIPSSSNQLYKLFYTRKPWIFLTAFIAPEVMVSSAAKEWCDALQQVKDFRLEGYEWSMAHGFFVDMGGFEFHSNGNGSRIHETITSLQFRRLCEKGEIMNPDITQNDIKAIGNSDALGRVVFMVQLLWFILQIIARGVEGLAITLVELYTLSMIALAVEYTFFWWDKPHRPQSPHIFYQSEAPKILSKEKLSTAWMAEPSGSHGLISRLFRIKASSSTEEGKTFPRFDGFQPRKPSKLIAMMENVNPVDIQLFSLYLAWIIIGGLHLVAWNWAFPTETEKIMWRVASLVLFTSPFAMIFVSWLERFGLSSDDVTYILGTAGVVARALLVGLMLASLRALPSSAYEPVNWTTFIPHF